MKANELRIGNYIFNDTDIVTVIGISKTAVEISSDENEQANYTCYKYSDIHPELSPVPLTEEWLMEFGFGITCNIVADKNKVELVYEQGIWRYYLSKTTWKDIMYVHQLQNLYFALTGEELTVK